MTTTAPGRRRDPIALATLTLYRYQCDHAACTWQSQLTAFARQAHTQYDWHVQQHHHGDAALPCTRCAGGGYAGRPGHGAGQQQRWQR
jgi:hypothetical protein